MIFVRYTTEMKSYPTQIGNRIEHCNVEIKVDPYQ